MQIVVIYYTSRYKYTATTVFSLKANLQLSSWHLQLPAGMADDARIPSSEGIIIETYSSG